MGAVKTKHSCAWCVVIQLYNLPHFMVQPIIFQQRGQGFPCDTFQLWCCHFTHENTGIVAMPNPEWLLKCSKPRRFSGNIINHWFRYVTLQPVDIVKLSGKPLRCRTITDAPWTDACNIMFTVDAGTTRKASFFTTARTGTSICNDRVRSHWIRMIFKVGQLHISSQHISEQVFA